MKFFYIKGLLLYSFLLMPLACFSQPTELLLFYANDVQGEVDPCG